MTIAARVPSRDSCSSVIGPGNLRRHRGGDRRDPRRLPRGRLLDHPHHVVAVDHHPDRVVQRPARAATACGRRWPATHPRRPGRPTATTPCPARRAAASPPTPPPARCATASPPSGRASARTTRAPAAPSGRRPTPAIRRPARAAPRPRRVGAGVGGRHVGGLPAVGEPVVERGAVGVDHVRPVDPGPRQRPDDLRGKQLPAVRIGGRQVLQVDARTAVAAADARLAAVGAGHRAAQPQRRAEQVAHRAWPSPGAARRPACSPTRWPAGRDRTPRRSADRARRSCRWDRRSTACCACRSPGTAASPGTPRWAACRCANRRGS